MSLLSVWSPPDGAEDRTISTSITENINLMRQIHHLLLLVVHLFYTSLLLS